MVDPVDRLLGKISCSVALSSERSQVEPNGFSTMTRARCGETRRAIPRAIRANKRRRHLEVEQDLPPLGTLDATA